MFSNTFTVFSNTFTVFSNTFTVFSDTFTVFSNTFIVFSDTFTVFSNTFKIRDLVLNVTFLSQLSGARELQKRTGSGVLPTYAEVLELSFKAGPAKLHKWAKVVR
jgi:hypothetical protein